MNASDKHADWIARVVKDNPFTLLDNGNIRTCPVRLSFPNIFKPGKPIPPNTEGKYGANLIIPPIAETGLIVSEVRKAILAKWPTAGTPQGPKLKSPFKKQNEMLKYEGYNEEGIFLTTIAGNKVPCVHQNMSPVVDESKVYPGVWAIVTIRPFVYDKGVNKGASFGLQSVMLVADDKNLGGGGSNPVADFAGVKFDSSVNPSALFGSEGVSAGEYSEAAAVLFA